MVNAVGNPATGLTGFISDVIHGGGRVVQGANQAHSDLAEQEAIIKNTGESESVNAQRAASEASDKNQAALIGLQSEETRNKQTQDILNAVKSGKDDSFNKMVSATAQNAKGISY